MDEARFERIYSANAPSIVRYCSFSAGSTCDGEDIAAEVFSRFITKGERLCDGDATKWLFTVARNLCASHHRTRQRQARLATRLAEQPVVFEDSALNDVETWSYLRSLKERERLIVYLHAVEERPFAEVAGLLGRSLSAVKMTYYRALDRMRDQMARESVGVPGRLSGGASDA